MKVKLKADKSIEFLDGSGTINTNDVMRQVLEVETEDGVIAKNESLWVVFFRDGFTYTGEILFESTERAYKTLMPQEVLAIAGEWSLQLLVRMYSTTDTTKYVNQFASVVETFTIQNGLPVENGAQVNNATIGNLYNTVLQNANNAAQSAGAAADCAQEAEKAAQKAEAVAQETAEAVLDSKLDKATTKPGDPTRVYCVDVDGEQIMIPVQAYSSEGNSIPRRTDYGSIIVSAPPRGDKDAAPKRYVDDILQAAKDYTDSELAEFDFIKVVATLPESGLPNKIYLVAKTDTADNADLFDEYIWINDQWEFVGTKQFEIDLSGYVTTDTAQTIKGAKAFENPIAVQDTVYANGSVRKGGHEVSFPDKDGALAVDSDTLLTQEQIDSLF